MRYLSLFSGLEAASLACSPLGWQCAGSPTLRGMNSDERQNGGGHVAMVDGLRVRRFTPLECERLQGIPDGYTLVTYRKRRAKDGPRYKAIGNSFAVPVIQWIGRRIDRAINKGVHNT